MEFLRPSDCDSRSPQMKQVKGRLSAEGTLKKIIRQLLLYTLKRTTPKDSEKKTRPARK